jgi:hypothetical protein
MMPPMITPRLPIAAPAAVLLWAPPTSARKIDRGPIAVSLRSHDRTIADTVPQNAPRSGE